MHFKALILFLFSLCFLIGDLQVTASSPRIKEEEESNTITPTFDKHQHRHSQTTTFTFDIPISNQKRVMPMFDKSALSDHGNAGCYVLLGLIYSKCHAACQNFDESQILKVFTSQAIEPNLITEICDLYKKGYLISPDFEKAINYYQKALDILDTSKEEESHRLMIYIWLAQANCFEHERNPYRDLTSAFDLYYKAYETAKKYKIPYYEWYASQILGDFFHYGWGVEQDSKRASCYYEKSFKLSEEANKLRTQKVIQGISNFVNDIRMERPNLSSNLSQAKMTSSTSVTGNRTGKRSAKPTKIEKQQQEIELFYILGEHLQETSYMAPDSEDCYRYENYAKHEKDPELKRLYNLVASWFEKGHISSQDTRQSLYYFQQIVNRKAVAEGYLYMGRTLKIASTSENDLKKRKEYSIQAVKHFRLSANKGSAQACFELIPYFEQNGNHKEKEKYHSLWLTRKDKAQPWDRPQQPQLHTLLNPAAVDLLRGDPGNIAEAVDTPESQSSPSNAQAPKKKKKKKKKKGNSRIDSSNTSAKPIEMEEKKSDEKLIEPSLNVNVPISDIETFVQSSEADLSSSSGTAPISSTEDPIKKIDDSAANNNPPPLETPSPVTTPPSEPSTAAIGGDITLTSIELQTSPKSLTASPRLFQIYQLDSLQLKDRLNEILAPLRQWRKNRKDRQQREENKPTQRSIDFLFKNDAFELSLNTESQSPIYPAYANTSVQNSTQSSVGRSLPKFSGQSVDDNVYHSQKDVLNINGQILKQNIELLDFNSQLTQQNMELTDRNTELTKQNNQLARENDRLNWQEQVYSEEFIKYKNRLKFLEDQLSQFTSASQIHTYPSYPYTYN